MSSKEWKEANKEKQKAYSRNWYLRNRKSEIDKAKVRTKNGRVERRLWLDKYKRSLCCNSCGISFEDNPEWVDFHHLDPSVKDKEISKMMKNHSEKEILLELEKCVPLCSNCHRTIHKKTIPE